MEIPLHYLTLAGELFAVFILIVVIFFILMRRDKKNLLSYVERLKDKVSQLKKTIAEQAAMPDATEELLEETIEHVKESYKQTFGHEIGTQTTVGDDNSKEHFIHVMGYQSLKTELSALRNSRSAENAWEKIVSQVGPLIDNYRITPETQIQQVQGNDLPVDAQEQEKAQGSVTFVPDSKLNSGRSANVHQADMDRLNAANAQVVSERQTEIERLRNQISDQFEDIWQLKAKLADKAAQSDEPDSAMAGDINTGLETITQQLKDAQLCITMMDSEIQTANEQILDLNEQLAKAKPIDHSAHNNLADQLKMKDDTIARLTQENKEIETLIDGMEKSSSEQTQRILALEEELKQLKVS